MKRALQVVLAISLLGTLFSGSLVYKEMFTSTIAACPSPGQAGTILGYPACVYGLVMYLALSAVSIIGLTRGRPQ